MQGQAHAQALRLAEREPRACNRAHAIHRGDEDVVGRKLLSLRPIREVHALAAGQAAPDLVGDERRERSGDAGESFEHGEKRIEGIPIITRPKAVATSPHVPVGEHFGEVAQCGGREGSIERFELRCHLDDEVARLGEQVAIEHVGRVGAAPGLADLARVGVEGEEVVGAPEREKKFAHSRANAILGDDEVAPANHRARHQEPSHGVGAVALKHLAHVRVVAQALRHLLPVVTEHDAVTDHAAERGAVEQRGGEHMHRVEPAARLTDVLDDEIAGVVALKPLPVLKGVVHLREGHRARVEPHVKNVFDAAHRRAARRVVRVRASQLVDERAVQVDLALGIARHPAEISLKLGERAVDVDARVVGVIAFPHRDRAAPIAIAADRPVARALEPLTELPVLDVPGHPRDLLVQLKHAIAQRRDRHKPARHGLVDERVAATPTVRITVLVAAQLKEPPPLAQQAHEGLVGVEHLDSGDLGHLLKKPPTVVDRDDDWDARRGTNHLVVFAVRGRLMHDARALPRGDVVGNKNLPGVLHAPGLDIGVVIPDAVVLHAAELGARDRARRGGAGGRGIDVAEFAKIGRDGVGSEQEGASIRSLGTRAVDGASAPRHDRVFDRGTHGERRVCRQGPRRRRPSERLNPGQPKRLGLLAHERKRHRHRLVLPRLVNVVVHAQLVVRQWRLVAPAVWQHAIALVGQPFLMQGLEGPQHAFHKCDVERLVVVLEIDPARLTRPGALPLVGVAQHALAGLRVEGFDAHVFDLRLLGDAELLHGLELSRQPVGIPAEPTVHLLATHRLKPGEYVFRVSREQVAVVRQPVGERRAVVEHPLVAALALGHRAPEGVVRGPVGEHLVLERRKIRRGHDRAVGAVKGVNHGFSGRWRCGRCLCSHRMLRSLPARTTCRDRPAAVPPRLRGIRHANRMLRPSATAVTGLPRSGLLVSREGDVLPRTPR